LHGANIGARIAFVSLFAGLPLRALRPLRAGWPLGSRHTLNALCTLRSGRTLCARVALRTRIATAAGKSERDTDSEQRNLRICRPSQLRFCRFNVAESDASCQRNQGLGSWSARRRLINWNGWGDSAGKSDGPPIQMQRYPLQGTARGAPPIRSHLICGKIYPLRGACARLRCPVHSGGNQLSAPRLNPRALSRSGFSGGYMPDRPKPLRGNDGARARRGYADWAPEENRIIRALKVVRQ
jgi:hypothetical protein